MKQLNIPELIAWVDPKDFSRFIILPNGNRLYINGFLAGHELPDIPRA